MREPFTKQDINELLGTLDAYAREVDNYEYGLPLYDEGQLARMREVVHEWWEALSSKQVPQ